MIDRWGQWAFKLQRGAPPQPLLSPQPFLEDSLMLSRREGKGRLQGVMCPVHKYHFGLRGPVITKSGFHHPEGRNQRTDSGSLSPFPPRLRLREHRGLAQPPWCECGRSVVWEKWGPRGTQTPGVSPRSPACMRPSVHTEQCPATWTLQGTRVSRRAE